MTDSGPVLAVQIGHPPPGVRSVVGEQGDWFTTSLASTTPAVTVISPANDEPSPEPGRFAAIMATASWAMLTQQLDWSEHTAV